MSDGEFAPVTPGEMLKDEFPAEYRLSQSRGKGGRHLAQSHCRNRQQPAAHHRRHGAEAGPLFRHLCRVLDEPCRDKGSVAGVADCRSADRRAIVDAGLKGLAFASGPPVVCDEPAATYDAPPTSTAGSGSRAPPIGLGLGDKIRLVPGHCDPTVNLYDWYVAIRANRVEQLWPITAGGAVY